MSKASKMIQQLEQFSSRVVTSQGFPGADNKIYGALSRIADAGRLTSLGGGAARSVYKGHFGAVPVKITVEMK